MTAVLIVVAFAAICIAQAYLIQVRGLNRGQGEPPRHELPTPAFWRTVAIIVVIATVVIALNH